MERLFITLEFYRRILPPKKEVIGIPPNLREFEILPSRTSARVLAKMHSLEPFLSSHSWVTDSSITFLALKLQNLFSNWSNHGRNIISPVFAPFSIFCTPWISIFLLGYQLVQKRLFCLFWQISCPSSNNLRFVFLLHWFVNFRAWFGWNFVLFFVYFSLFFWVQTVN